ncbi:tyrosine-type recombinase/integrase [Streptomyces sp. NPDC054770]
MYYPAFLLLCLLGLRRAEVCGLRWENIDLDNRVLWVEQQRQRSSAGTIDLELKTDTSKAPLPLPLPAQCIAPLRWTRMRTAMLRERALSMGRPCGSKIRTGTCSSRGRDTRSWPRTST